MLSCSHEAKYVMPPWVVSSSKYCAGWRSAKCLKPKWEEVIGEAFENLSVIFGDVTIKENIDIGKYHLRWYNS